MKIEKILVVAVVVLGVLFILNVFGVFDRLKAPNDKVYSEKEVALMWALKNRNRQVDELLIEIEQIHNKNEENWKKYGVDSITIYNSNDRYADSLRSIYNPKEL